MRASSSTAFDVTYRIERQDYREMMHAYWSLTPFRRWRVRLLMAIPGAAAVVCLAQLLTTHDPYFLLLAAIAASAFGIAPLINDLSYDRVYRRLELENKELHLTADATGLSTTMTGKGESKIPWSGIAAATFRPSHVFLWLTPYNAIIVPRRAHRDAASADSFETHVRTWTHAAQQ